MASSKVQNLLNQIEGETADATKRLELLESLRALIASLSKSELVEAGNASLEVLFEYLSSDNEDEIATICGILKTLMLVLDPSTCLQKYHDPILQGFQHPHGSVRALVIAQLQSCVESSKQSLDLLCSEYQDLIIASIHQLTLEDLSAANAADNFLISLVQTQTGGEFLLGHAGISSFKTILNSPRVSDTVKFRVLETLSKFGTFTPEYLQKIEEQHLLLEPLSEIVFTSQDVLGQLNGLEILSIVAQSKHGIDNIEKRDIFKKIQRLCVNWEEDSMRTLVFPGILKFIGKVGLTQIPPVELVDIDIDAFLKSSNDFALATVAFESLAFIGSNIDGKAYLDEKSNFKPCFERLQWLISEAPTEFRSRILDSLAILFSSGVEGEGPECLPKWFRLVFPQQTTLFNIVQHSFPEIRLSALKLLVAIAHFEWAQNYYLRIPGVVEFLLQRNIEPNKDCGAAKFQIVSIVAKSTTSSKFLALEDIGRLKIHVDQGIGYSEAQTIVAMEFGG